MSAKRSIISIIMPTRCCVSAAAARDPAAAERNQYLFLRAARRRRGHRAVEFSSGDSHRYDCGGTGYRQLRADEARRAVAAAWRCSCPKFCLNAGLPDGACQLLQGGGEIGAHLVRSPRIHLIAFTGSREVGLEILARSLHASARTSACEARRLRDGRQERRHRRQRRRSGRSGGACYRFRFRLSGAKMLGGFAADSTAKKYTSAFWRGWSTRCRASRSVRPKIRAMPSAR